MTRGSHTQGQRDLFNKIKEFQDSPGVYLMKDARGRIIYIGKAKSLKKRVQSYFRGDKDIKTRFLVGRVADIDTIITLSLIHISEPTRPY